MVKWPLALVRAESSGPARSGPTRCTTTHCPATGTGPWRVPRTTVPSSRFGEPLGPPLCGRGSPGLPPFTKRSQIELAEVLGAQILEILLELLGAQLRRIGGRGRNVRRVARHVLVVVRQHQQ